MSISPEHASRHLYHFTLLENLEGVLRHGFLSFNEQRRMQIGHKSIASDSIQERRARMIVPCGPGGVVHDYVPLYFSGLSPMLLQLLNAKNVDQEHLVHFAFPISLLERPDVVFTDASANRVEQPNFFGDPAELARLNWPAIDSRKWSNADERTKQMRMAEALVHKKLLHSEAAYVIVWNESVKKRVESVFLKAGVAMLHIDYTGYKGHHPYFKNFRNELPEDMKGRTLAHGPTGIRAFYDHIVGEVLNGRVATPSASSARFETLAALLETLRSDGLAVLPETAELVGLESANEVHERDVGEHTLQVVSNLRISPIFAALSAEDQILTELAAYVHDIGKGPKSRWDRCGGRQQVDNNHPIRSAEMMKRILLEEVKALSDREVRVLIKLVCYHDLVGDICGRGRKRQQLIDIADDSRDVDMLVAIGHADALSVRETWGELIGAQVNDLRTWAMSEIS